MHLNVLLNGVHKLLMAAQNDPNGLFVDADGLYHVYYQCRSLSQVLYGARANVP